jgi:hypothetical protein
MSAAVVSEAVVFADAVSKYEHNAEIIKTPNPKKNN